MGNLTNLTELYLSENQLSGEIPPELGNLANLIGLGLLGNQLGGCVPSSFLELLKEEESDVGGFLFCPMSTSQPTTRPPLAQTSLETDREALVVLYNATGGPNWNSNNNWLSDVPISEWEGVTTDGNGRVTELKLVANQLSGEIPAELGSLSNLTSLRLRYTDLSGEIPPELGSLSNLTSLDLSFTDLSGEIPPELGNLANLRGLGLNNNQLSGEIPPELGNLARLDWLLLNGNQLTGCVPSGLSGRLDMENSNLGGLQFCQ